MSKNFLIPLIIIIGGIFVGGALLLGGNEPSNSLGANVAQANLRKVNLEITNMFCIGCRSGVVNSVMTLPGVVQADADPRTGSGWVIYDFTEITKKQIIAAPIFQAYPARLLNDQKYIGQAIQGQATQIPPEIEQKLNLLAQRLQERNVQLESFFQEEIDEAISGGYWDKVNNLLDNFLQSYE